MKKIAIIGASHFQNPLIIKAKSMGIETHVFAWAADDIGERTADFFYPISIIDKESILEKCKQIEIHGICSIGSDLANITVAYVAANMGLTGNSVNCVHKSTDKYAMRRAFIEGGDPSPASIRVQSGESLEPLRLSFPVIVKPVDRSGSRGITTLEDQKGLSAAIQRSLHESFSNVALVEEYVEGREFSVEYISWKGRHQFLSVTEKFTTGAPMFIETGHLEPARITADELDKIKQVVSHALDTLEVEYGASHSEVKLDSEGEVTIIEIGSRMGGDCIGSDLVGISTNYDFLKAVIDVSLGHAPQKYQPDRIRAAAIRFVFQQTDIDILELLSKDRGVKLVHQSEIGSIDHEVRDSSTRSGYYIFSADTVNLLEAYLPRLNGIA